MNAERKRRRDEDEDCRPRAAGWRTGETGREQRRVTIIKTALSTSVQLIVTLMRFCPIVGGVFRTIEFGEYARVDGTSKFSPRPTRRIIIMKTSATVIVDVTLLLRAKFRRLGQR